MWICRKCNEQNSDNYNFCNKCGKPRPKDKPTGKGWVCVKCKSENWNNDQCCRACGSPRDAATPDPFRKKPVFLYGIIVILLILAIVLAFPKEEKVPAPSQNVASSAVETPHPSNVTVVTVENERSFEHAFALARVYGSRRFVAATDRSVIGVKPDGTCITAGDYLPGVDSWENIVKVSACDYAVAGLKSDGTVVCTDSALNVGTWREIIQIEYCCEEPFASNNTHLVGLDVNGRTVAVGDNSYGQCYVQDWVDIVDISAGAHHTVGLKANGTVIVTGSNESGQCEVSSWENIVDVAAGRFATYGLTADGRILVAGAHKNKLDEEKVLEVPQWKDVVAIIAGNEGGTAEDFIVGIRSDGTIVTNHEGYVSEEEIASFSDVRSMAVSSWGYMICVDSRGQVKSIGWDVDGTRVVDSWPALMTG